MLGTLLMKLAGVDRPAPTPGLTRSARRRAAAADPSFADFLPWVDYFPDEQAFLLQDGVSRGAVFELAPTPTEGRSPEALAQQADALRIAVNGSFPELDSGEWVLQFFAQDDIRIDTLYDDLVDYIRPDILRSAFTQDYLARMQRHLQRVSRPQGLFLDAQVSGLRFRGRRRRIRAVVYRRHDARGAAPQDGLAPADELRTVCDRFRDALRQGGIAAWRYSGRDFYDWLLPWFNPRSGIAPGGAAELLKAVPYPGDDDLPFGRDLAELLLLSKPRSDAASGRWYFDDLPHAALTFQQLRRKPPVGLLTAEREIGDGTFYALFDKLPDGAVLSMTLTMRPQDRLRDHVNAIEKAASGDSAEAELTRDNCRAVKRRMAQGDKLLPLNLVLYLRGEDDEDLRRKINSANATLLPSGVKFIDERQDLVALSAYLRGLPMAFCPEFDLRRLKRSRLVFSSDVARLLPLYGRARGTGKPCIVGLNRGGEPLLFDPLHKEDRKKNAFMVLFGPPGSGKSASCTKQLMETMAVHRPRQYIVEVGGSFRLLGQHYRRLGLTVNQVTLTADADVSLPPFAAAYPMLDQAKRFELSFREEDVPDSDEPPDPNSDADDERRDLLGEMEITARMMITGGEERETAKLTRADRYLIRRAIVDAARACRGAGRPIVLTEDVAHTLQGYGGDPSLPEPRRLRASEMGDAMMLFCDGVAGRFFNRPGQLWPDADVTVLDVGLFAREGYEDLLAVALVSFMNAVTAQAELRQHEERPGIFLIDEAHLVTMNPLLAPFAIKIVKMWRKLGMWLWMSTQNLADVPDTARRMLNIMEWWICLAMPREEVEQVKRFRQLSPELEALLLSARKEPGKYTEAVVMSDTLRALYRNVPPPLAVTLAMTEKHEKARRAEIMRERGCSELDAAYHMAAQMEAEGAA